MSAHALPRARANAGPAKAARDNPRRAWPAVTQPLASPKRGTHVLLDTGVLVALFNRLDARHGAVTAWMQSTQAVLLTVAPVLSETAFFELELLA